LRLAILAAGRQDLAGLGNFAPHFPVARISYQAADHDTAPSASDAVPPTLVRQLRNLASSGLPEDIYLSVTDDTVTVSLPVAAGQTFEVDLDKTPPHRVKRVKVQRGSNTVAVDITSTVMPRGGNVQLVRVYRDLTSALRSGNFARPPASRGARLAARLWDLLTHRVDDTQWPETNAEDNDGE
jgi:hypothetical protein